MIFYIIFLKNIFINTFVADHNKLIAVRAGIRR